MFIGPTYNFLQFRRMVNLYVKLDTGWTLKFGWQLTAGRLAEPSFHSLLKYSVQNNNDKFNPIGNLNITVSSLAYYGSLLNKIHKCTNSNIRKWWENLLRINHITKDTMAIGYMYFAMFHFSSCVYNLYKIQEFIESIKRIQSVFSMALKKYWFGSMRVSEETKYTTLDD